MVVEARQDDIIARDEVGGRLYEYRIAYNPQPDAPQMKYQIQVRVVGGSGQWDSATMGYSYSRDAALAHFAERYRGDITEVEAIDPNLKENIRMWLESKRIRDAAETERRDKEERGHQEANRKLYDRRHTSEEGFKSVHFKNQKTKIATATNVALPDQTGPSLNGLTVTKSGGMYGITHQKTGFSVATRFHTMKDAKIGLWRLTKLGDWDKEDKELRAGVLKTDGLGSFVHRLENDALGAEWPSGYKPTQKTEAKPETTRDLMADARKYHEQSSKLAGLVLERNAQLGMHATTSQKRAISEPYERAEAKLKARYAHLKDFHPTDAQKEELLRIGREAGERGRKAIARLQKEPWEMKRGDYTQWYQAEWRRSGVRNVEADWIWAQKTHEMSVKDAIKDGKPVPAEVLKDYPELGKKDEQKPATAPESNLDHAYYDWTSHNAYWSHNGYRLKSPGKPYAPWNKAVKAKYGDDNGRFHDDAVAWAKAHNTSNLPSIQRLQWDEEERSSRGSKQDRARSHKITVEPYDPRIKRWRRDHGSMDIEGIDTKVTIRTVPEKERAPKEKPQFSIRRKVTGPGRGRDLGADIVKDRRGRHLRL